MQPPEATQRTYINLTQDTYLLSWIEAFLEDRKAQRLAAGTLSFYRQKLKHFADYCESRQLKEIGQLDSRFLRGYLLHLEEIGHNAGGVHAAYRSVKAFLNWYDAEAEPEAWKNPIRKVKAPKVDLEIIEPLELDDFSKMLDACQGSDLTSTRDRALLSALLDTGARAREFLDMQLQDLTLTTGAITIRRGKNRRPRTVYLGQKSRRAVRAYIKKRNDNNPALWATNEGEKLTYWGLRSIIERRAKTAGIQVPGAHDFRRAFAINYLRNNPGDIYRLRDLMGHTTVNVLIRYLKFLPEDLQEGHKQGSPVDHSGLNRPG